MLLLYLSMVWQYSSMCLYITMNMHNYCACINKLYHLYYDYDYDYYYDDDDDDDDYYYYYAPYKKAMCNCNVETSLWITATAIYIKHKYLIAKLISLCRLQSTAHVLMVAYQFNDVCTRLTPPQA